jgi:hypothetical protein
MASYGKRVDGTWKGSGWLGELKMQDGSDNVATELSAGYEVDGKERLMPLIVPTLSKDELDVLLRGEKPTKEIFDKAYDHGLGQIKAGKSPFANDGEDPEYLKKIGIR